MIKEDENYEIIDIEYWRSNVYSPRDIYLESIFQILNLNNINYEKNRLLTSFLNSYCYFSLEIKLNIISYYKHDNCYYLDDGEIDYLFNQISITRRFDNTWTYLGYLWEKTIIIRCSLSEKDIYKEQMKKLYNWRGDVELFNERLNFF